MMRSTDKSLQHKFKTLKAKGQSLAEYGLILALVAIACIAVLGQLGNTLQNKISTVNNAINSASGTGTAPSS